MLLAIGEIVLVMLGILLAIQVDNWNQSRQDRKTEKVLLKEINEEFRYNKAEFLGNMGRYDQVRVHLREIRGFFPIKLDEIDLDTMSSLLREIVFQGNYDPSTTSINKLKSTASLNIISDDELRYLLIKWETLLEDFLKDEKIALDYHQNIFAIVMSQKLPRPYRKYIRDPRVDHSFLESLEFQGLIDHKYRSVHNMFRTLENDRDVNLLTVMNRIIELTDSPKS